MLPTGVEVGAETEGDCEEEPLFCPLEELLELLGLEVDVEEFDELEEDGLCVLEGLLAPPVDVPPSLLPVDELPASDDQVSPVPDDCVSAVISPLEEYVDSSCPVSADPVVAVDEPALFSPAATEDELSFPRI